MTPTTEQMDTLIKSVKDATDALKVAQASDKENIKATVEQVLKDVLGNDQRVTEQRKILFGDNQPSGVEAMLEAMPKEAREQIDNCFIMSKMLKVPVTSLKSWKKFGAKFADFKKALDTAASGGGTEWVPTDFTSNLWELVRVQGAVAPLFPVIPMPTKVYEVPIQLGRIRSYKHAEQTGDTGQTKIPVGDGSTLTGKVTLTAAGHAARVLVSKDLEEDSIIPMLPWLQSQIVMALAEGREDCILNGDTAGAMDSDNTASDDRNRLWNGLRYLALNTSGYSYDLSTLTLSNIRKNLRAGMGKYGVNPADMAYICDLRSYIHMIDLDTVTTLDKMGPNATVLKGQLGAIDGSPVIVSEWARNTLNASGVYDGTTVTKGGLILVHRRGFVVGERRQATVQVLRELYAESDQDALVTRERVTFRDTYPIASNPTVAFGYNIG